MRFSDESCQMINVRNYQGELHGKIKNERDEIEIDLVELFYVLWGHVWLILSIGLFVRSAVLL